MMIFQVWTNIYLKLDRRGTKTILGPAGALSPAEKFFLMKEVRDGKSKETRWIKYNNSKLQQ